MQIIKKIAWQVIRGVEVACVKVYHGFFFYGSTQMISIRIPSKKAI